VQELFEVIGRLGFVSLLIYRVAKSPHEEVEGGHRDEGYDSQHSDYP
jgi:hypothetical protein